MNWRTAPIALALRSFGRRWGINALIMSFWSPSGYESKFNSGMLSCVGPDDVVWDVGANVGLYTRRFSEIVGPRGTVYAFEPSPLNFAKLTENVKGFPNAVLLPFGLGDKEEAVSFVQGADELGATSQVWGASDGLDRGDRVRICVADQMAASGKAAVPNFIKIDVEGFELEVLRGMSAMLRDAKVRGVGVELHFGLLASRGMEGAPREIEGLLVSSGFDCSWPDASHLLAVRPG